MEWNTAVKERIESRLNEKENSLAAYACKSAQAIRFHEALEDLRPNFFPDSDKIIHAYCYSRYLDKTRDY